MKVLLYIGTHIKDSPLVRLGWALTRMVQKGKNWRVTHVEAVLDEHDDGTMTIASASLRDGGIRIKRTKIVLDHWEIVDVSIWNVEKARAWFAEHAGQKYDVRGAFSSAFPFQWTQRNRWFCNQAVSAPFLDSPEIFGPSQFASICKGLS